MPGDKKISGLPAAGAVTGAELLEVTQAGASKKATASALVAGSNAAMTDAGAITGTETVPITQSGSAKKATVNSLVAGANAAMANAGAITGSETVPITQSGAAKKVTIDTLVAGTNAVRSLPDPGVVGPISSLTAVGMFATTLNVDLTVVGAMVDIETFGVLVNNTGSNQTATFGAVTAGFAYGTLLTPALATNVNARWWRHRMRVRCASAGQIVTAEQLDMGGVLNLGGATSILMTNGPSSASVTGGPVSVFPQVLVSNAGVVVTPQFSFVTYSQI